MGIEGFGVLLFSANLPVEKVITSTPFCGFNELERLKSHQTRTARHVWPLGVKRPLSADATLLQRTLTSSIVPRTGLR